jgi:hypothetical protein
LKLSPIRVAPGGRYFETFDHQPFLFFGPNDAITWPGLAGLYRRRDIEGVEKYLESLASNGVTILRLMLEYAHVDGRYFERPAGKFNPALIRLWDDLFERCERFGLRVLLAPWDNFWMALRWHRHPYNVANGGPAHSPAAFFTDEATIAATERRLLFVIERWGGNSAFAAWDLFNEIHPHWGGTPQQQSAVIARLSETVRRAEERMWGWTRPQTVSIFGPQPNDGYEELIFRHPHLDFATTHIYEGAIDYPHDTVLPAQTMARWVRHAFTHVPARRPFMDSEHGPIHLFNNHKKYLPEEFDDEYERHMMWAHLASGGAGSGMRWPARHPHIITDGMKQATKSMNGFSQLLDWRHFTPRDAAHDVSITLDGVPYEGVHAFGSRDEKQALIWLLRAAPKDHRGILPHGEPLHNAEVSLQGLAPAKYLVCGWNTQSGRKEWSQLLQTGADGTLRIELPALPNDLALAISPEIGQ